MDNDQDSDGVVPTPKIVEAYRDYIPPQYVLHMVGDLLKTVRHKYLVGLQTVVLINQAAQPRKTKQQKVWSRKRKIKLVEALGYYSGASRSSTPVKPLKAVFARGRALEASKRTARQSRDRTGRSVSVRSQGKS